MVDKQATKKILGGIFTLNDEREDCDEGSTLLKESFSFLSRTFCFLSFYGGDNDLTTIPSLHDQHQ